LLKHEPSAQIPWQNTMLGLVCIVFIIFSLVNYYLLDIEEAAASSMSLAVPLDATCRHMAGITSTVLALARFAIMRSWSGLIDRSAVATMYQVGLVFQADL